MSSKNMNLFSYSYIFLLQFFFKRYIIQSETKKLRLFSGILRNIIMYAYVRAQASALLKGARGIGQEKK